MLVKPEKQVKRSAHSRQNVTADNLRSLLRLSDVTKSENAALDYTRQISMFNRHIFLTNRL